jgi:hypothetical protein
MGAFGGVVDFVGKKTGNVAAAGAIGFALNAGLTYSGYKDNEARGMNPVLAAAKAIGSTILMNEFLLPMTAIQLAPLFPILNQQYQNAQGRAQRNLMPMGPGRFQDSAYAQTSRARALQSIQMSRMNARQYVGQEAGLFASRYR